MTAKEIVRRLQAEGWFLVSQKGSHAKYRKVGNGVVIVPMHKGDLPEGTWSAIKRQAGWK